MTSTTQPSDEAVERALAAKYSDSETVRDCLAGACEGLGATLAEITKREIIRAALAAANAELVAEVARLQKSLDELHGAPFSDRCYHALKSRAETAERERDALTAELARREEAGVRDGEDARRYRWLKANGKPAADGLAMRKAEDWDAAIDSAAEGKS